MSYLLQENGSRIILEDGSGFLLLEDVTPDVPGVSGPDTGHYRLALALCNFATIIPDVPGISGPDPGHYRLALALCTFVAPPHTYLYRLAVDQSVLASGAAASHYEVGYWPPGADLRNPAQFVVVQTIIGDHFNNGQFWAAEAANWWTQHVTPWPQPVPIP